jgi:HD-GYP domain-containing protein (c-di-GMP phosphodiesterase class II)
MQSVFEGVKTGAPIHSVTVQQTVQRLLETLMSNHDVLLCAHYIRQFDGELFTHALNVCVFSLIVGVSHGFSRTQLESLGAGALLHDIGEVQLPYNLLHKETTFTEQERRLMQQHPALGHAILIRAGSMPEETWRIVLEHHERFDGSGYPTGCKGEGIDSCSALVGIIDTYDAMLSAREGRPALRPARAMQELYARSGAGEYDPYWVEQVMQCIGLYPVGSMVELNTGEVGIILATNPADVLRPTVEILWDATHRRYQTPLRVSLASSDVQQTKRTIVRTVPSLDTGATHPGKALVTVENKTLGGV